MGKRDGRNGSLHGDGFELMPILRTTQEQQPLSQLRAPQIIDPTSLTTSAATVFTVGDNEDFDITHLWVANVTGSAATYTIHIVPDGGSAATTNAVVFQKNLAANTSEVVEVLVGQTVPPGATIQALTGTNAAINIGGAGFERQGAYG